MNNIALVISCEHAVDTVPEQYLSLFAPFKSLLASHRGVDFGALALAEYLAQRIPCDFIQAACTRLLVDCNRSVNHPNCFSEITQNLPSTEKQQILERYYWPFRLHTMDKINQHVEHGFQVWHLSIHSFTPVFNDITRNTEIGLLYDPHRIPEKVVAKQWKTEIRNIAPDYRVRMNYPYKGTSDGFTTLMRKKHNEEVYVGIELETNQVLTMNDKKIHKLKEILTSSLLNLIC